MKCLRQKHLKNLVNGEDAFVIQTTCSGLIVNRPFAACHSRGTKPPCWDTKVTLGQDKQRKLPFKIMYAFC